MCNMADDLTTPAGRLKYARDSRHKTASEFLRKVEALKGVKIPQPTYSGHESGSRHFDDATAQIYAEVLNNCTASWLKFGAPDGAPPGARAKDAVSAAHSTPAREAAGSFRTDFGRRLRFAREYRMQGVPVEAVAKALGWEALDLLAYENGEKPMIDEDIVMFTARMDISYGFLLHGNAESLSDQMRKLWLKSLGSDQ